MSSKYVDNTSIIQVIGSVFNAPSLLDITDKFVITDEDFADDFHKIVYGAIYKIHQLGGAVINLQNIEDFLSSRPKSQSVFNARRGAEWLLKASQAADVDVFEYYYNRLKKFSLLRAYDNYGIDVSDIYDVDNVLEPKKKQAQEDYLDNSSLEDIANKIDLKISNIRLQYVDDAYGQAEQAGEGILELIDKFKAAPEVGIPMFGTYINTVTRGARLKKFYLRSAPTGVGKTRTLIADACYFSCSEIYYDAFGWLKLSSKQPTLYITTEQELEEVQTMMLAFISNVSEENIINGRYEGDEEMRVRKAAQIIKNAPLYVEELPDFSLKDIENTIKKNIRDHNIKYCCHDYIHTSMKILEEITKRSGGVKLREDNILFMLSNKLKDICNQYGIFIISATQLNGSYVDAEVPDQNLLRGAKSIADKIDYGALLLGVTPKDLESLNTILSANSFDQPTIKLSIYKNRRGRYKGIYLWCKANLGCCRVEPMFATTYGYDLIQMDDIEIKITPAEAF